MRSHLLNKHTREKVHKLTHLFHLLESKHEPKRSIDKEEKERYESIIRLMTACSAKLQSIVITFITRELLIVFI